MKNGKKKYYNANVQFSILDVPVYIEKVKTGQETQFNPLYHHTLVFTTNQEKENSACQYLIKCFEICFVIGSLEYGKLAISVIK